MTQDRADFLNDVAQQISRLLRDNKVTIGEGIKVLEALIDAAESFAFKCAIEQPV